MRALVVAIVLGLGAGCAQTITAAEDSGSTAGPRADGGPSGEDARAVDAEARLDGSEDAATGGSTDAGSRDASAPDATASSAEIVWSEMILPPNTRFLQAVYGRSPTEVYAASTSGMLYRYDGVAWNQIWRTNDNSALHDIAPHGASELLLAGDTSLHRFDGTNGTPTLRASARFLHAVISTGPTSAILAIEDRKAGLLGAWDGAMIREIHRPAMTIALYTLWGEPNGDILAGGTWGRILRLRSGAITPEMVAWPVDYDTNDQAGTSIRAIGRVGPKLFALANRHAILERDATGTWRFVYQNPGTNGDQLYAIAGGERAGGHVEGFAVGDAPRGGGIVRYDGTLWQPADQTDQWVLRDIWRANEHLYFAVGGVRNSFSGVILRGERRD